MYLSDMSVKLILKGSNQLKPDSFTKNLSMYDEIVKGAAVPLDTKKRKDSTFTENSTSDFKIFCYGAVTGLEFTLFRIIREASPSFCF